MINLLIVDDEKLILDEIYSSINWSRFNIENVYMANSMQKAIEIFAGQRVDILLCDIEMPQGSGLDLLKWIRENHPATLAIFLTCHAEFSYARQAIQMGSLDYILKPIDYNVVESALEKAIQKIIDDSSQLSLSQYGQFWSRHQPLLIEHFWIDILNHDITPLKADIEKAAAERNILLDMNIRLTPILIAIHKWHDKLSNTDKRLMEFSVKNVAQELLTGFGECGQTINLQNDMLLVILNSRVDFNKLKEQCDQLISSCVQFLKCDISCYIGDPVEVPGLASMAEALYNLRRNNVAYTNRVFFLTENQRQSSAVEVPDSDVLLLILNQGSRQKVLSQMTSCLTRIENKQGIDLGTLVKLQQNFLQALYVYLNSKNIKAEEFIRNNDDINQFAQSIRSLKDMRAWIENIISKANEYHINVNEDQSVIDKVKLFISQHISSELNRAEIASHVFLSPDYLTKLFKKETGLSISHYIILERVKIAKHLLADTKIPIRDVASRAGCINISYFSKLFKQCEKISPNDYRRKAQSGQL
jgi:two-component system, response regulator YesN